jgi:muramoyltetrapeptide carboxypeptidase
MLWGYGRTPSDYETESLKQGLFGGNAFKVMPDPSHEVSKESLNSSKLWKCWRKGIAQGRLLGGNISIVQVLLGSEFSPSYQDSILFLEGYCNSAEELGRRFAGLRQTGVFKRIKGAVIGYFFGNMVRDPSSNRPVGEIFLEAAKDFDFPILEIGEIGHNTPNCNLPAGAMARLDAGNLDFSIIEDFFI